MQCDFIFFFFFCRVLTDETDDGYEIGRGVPF